jgi:hypothetical protein
MPSWNVPNPAWDGMIHVETAVSAVLRRKNRTRAA